jgi:HPt (histidine-containing phosphotransfer) domain-containing protein
MNGPYDRDVALANAGDSEELLNELIEVFRQECPVLIEQIRTAIEEGDASTLHRTAHTLKGSANVLGAMLTAEVAQQIERFGRDGDLPAAAKQLPILQERVQQLQAALP